jgi:hypothetical protein
MRTPILALLVTSNLIPSLSIAQGEPQDGPAQQFGDKGEIVITNESNAGFNYYHYGAANDTPAFSQKSLVIEPALMYFSAKNFAVGLVAEIGHGWGLGASSNELAIGPRLGYNLKLMTWLSVLPRIGETYQHGWGTLSDGTTTSGQTFVFNIDSYFLVHPAAHFFLGIGPSASLPSLVRQNGNDGSKVIHVGIDFIMGGWL